MLPGADTLRRILGAALLAPSAENRHYLRFQVRSDCVRLLTTDRASWADQPHRQMLALLSYGAVVENAALRSAELGQAMAVTWWPEPSEPERVAEWRWQASTTPGDALGRAIEARHTNRRFYRRARAPAEALARVSAAADASPGTSLLWLDDAPRRALALKAIRVAETERFQRQALHAELFGAVRFEVGWKQSVGEGLPPGALQIEPSMRLPFALLRRWRVMRAACRIGTHLALGLRAGYLPCALSPHIGLVLASESREDLAALQAGRAFERVWLAATTEGLALQPMAAATALMHQRPGDGWVSGAAQARLSQLLDELCRGHAARPYLLFRLGHADAPSVVTGRGPLDDYIDPVD
ncbi:MAG: hypothetical protein ABIP61_12670 [Burkholderiaceae bacterium]